MVKKESVRVRFAPSPTGYLHIGGARTALFNYLFARHHKGKFLLRIEDTDLSRSNKEMTGMILRSLQWLGLEWDEAPVYQSARIEKYTSVCEELVRRGFAYPCFCTVEELAKKREAAQREYKYDRKCLQLSKNEVQEKLKRGVSRAIRFRVPDGETTFDDSIRGTVTLRNEEIDDFILLRSDNTPVYQVAVVVDDHDMGITHVIRGDDHLSNTPKQIMIYEAMGWSVPKFAHVPMILGPDRKRLSKRHGATSVEEYRTEGFLSQAVVNFLVLLGWSPGDDREIISLEEMVDSFTLDRVSKNPAVFDETKLTWMNSRYLSRASDEKLYDLVAEVLIRDGLADDVFLHENRGYVLRCIGLLKERMKKITDFIDGGRYFFEDPEHYEEKAVQKHWSKEGVLDWMRKIVRHLELLTVWKAEDLEKTVRRLAEEMGVGAGKIIHSVRVALTGSGASPGLFELMEVLGKERVIRRLRKAIDCLEKK